MLRGRGGRCAVLDGLVADPQRDVLGVAFGLRSGSAPERFLVGLAVLGLLSDVAADRPMLCLVDDAQWLDQTSAQVLAFVARPLDTESIAVLFGTRGPGPGGDLAGLPELALEGLSDADARALVASVIPGRLDVRVRDRIVAESGGNPLALLELPRGVTAADGTRLSNPDIATQLFMSPRTVEYHLHKVFTKLAISSRHRVHDALASGGSDGQRQSP
jgi:hypothetical protein